MPDEVQKSVIKLYEKNRDEEDNIIDFASRFVRNVFGDYEAVWCDKWVSINHVTGDITIAG